jgi:hypothetical protein
MNIIPKFYKSPRYQIITLDTLIITSCELIFPIIGDRETVYWVFMDLPKVAYKPIISH